MEQFDSPRRVRVKFCGITRREDALHAAALGADAIGLVFYPPSPRAVDIRRAAEIVAGLPPYLSVVGLFVDAAREQVREALAYLPIDLLQFHGDEPAEACRGYGRPYVKAVRMRDGVNLTAVAGTYADAAGLLLDSYREGLPGGTGATFDWGRIPRDLGKPVVLAGGLTPDNVGAAIAAVQPYAVDVSGGVEISKGLKDRGMMTAFMRGVASVHA